MPRKFAACLVFGCLAAGCASSPFGELAPPEYSSAVELRHAPFFPQRAYQCGPAALATILAESGVGVHPDELVPKVYLPARRGSLQPELLAASREYGRIPYVIAPEFSALLAEVAHGRPVLVLQNLGVKALPRWHYAVVVGFSRERDEVVLRSGTDRRRVTGAGVFARTWQRGGNWGVVALEPGELPATEDSHGYLQAVAAAESAGNTGLALPSYTAAAERWPDLGVAWLGLGNLAYGRGELGLAESLYRHALQAEPDHPPALNNLTSVLVEQSRCEEASAELQRALALSDLSASMTEAFAELQAEISTCGGFRDSHEFGGKVQKFRDGKFRDSQDSESRNRSPIGDTYEPGKKNWSSHESGANWDTHENRQHKH